MDADAMTIFNGIVQITTATGVILTAISSIMNRQKLNKVDKKLDAKAEEVKQVTVGKLDEQTSVLKANNAQQTATILKEVRNGNGKH